MNRRFFGSAVVGAVASLFGIKTAKVNPWGWSKLSDYPDKLYLTFKGTLCSWIDFIERYDSETIEQLKKFKLLERYAIFEEHRLRYGEYYSWMEQKTILNFPLNIPQ